MGELSESETGEEMVGLEDISDWKEASEVNEPFITGNQE